MLEGILVDLVPFSKRFSDLEHRWNNSEAVFFWDIGNRWIRTKAEIERRQQERQEEDDGDDSRAIFGIQTKDGTPMGLLGTFWINHAHRTALLTALIAEPEYWGSGYGTDALLLFVDYAFDWLDLRKLWLMTMRANLRVLRQMEKVGFTLEACHRNGTWTGEQWVDLLTYGLLRDEWPGRAVLVETLNLRAPKES